MWSGRLDHTSIKQKPTVILWLLCYFGECRVWLPNCCKVVRWEQLNKKAGFVLHKACSHQDSAGQAESGSLGLINHDLHSFIQHIQTQTHISLAASSADSSFLLLFNMWPYDFTFTVQGNETWDCWQKSCEMLVLDLQDLESKNPEKIFTFISKTKNKMNILSYTNACQLLLYIFPFFQVNTQHSLGLMEFTIVSDRVWIGWRKWGGKRGIRSS